MSRFHQALSKSSFGGQESVNARRSVTKQQQTDVMKKIAEKRQLTSKKRTH